MTNGSLEVISFKEINLKICVISGTLTTALSCKGSACNFDRWMFHLFTVKPGVCPMVQPGTGGICVEECRNDTQCMGNKKCCSNGCGHTCREPSLPSKTNLTKASSQNVFNFGIVIGVIAKEIFAMCNKKKEFFDFLLDLYTFSVL